MMVAVLVWLVVTVVAGWWGWCAPDVAEPGAPLVGRVAWAAMSAGVAVLVVGAAALAI